jgi:hypothetical protein
VFGFDSIESPGALHFVSFIKPYGPRKPFMFAARSESKKMTHSKYQGLKNNSSKIVLTLHLPVEVLHLLTWMLRAGEK